MREIPFVEGAPPADESDGTRDERECLPPAAATQMPTPAGAGRKRDLAGRFILNFFAGALGVLAEAFHRIAAGADEGGAEREEKCDNGGNRQAFHDGDGFEGLRVRGPIYAAQRWAAMGSNPRCGAF